MSKLYRHLAYLFFRHITACKKYEKLTIDDIIVIVVSIGNFVYERMKMGIHIVFVTPEIPGNTGNIARSCAATDTKLHLVRPLGFQIDEKSVKRAGLDYWEFLDMEVHDSLEEFLDKYKDKRKFFATTKGGGIYSDISFKDDDMILFGAESRGLPRELIEQNKEMTIRIPMSEDTRLRSLNLSNCANIILFEALRQLSFPNLK